jgi:hypothetical protein
MIHEEEERDEQRDRESGASQRDGDGNG